jgi:hypothetical protein
LRDGLIAVEEGIKIPRPVRFGGVGAREDPLSVVAEQPR